jgi:competence protein ComEC
VAHLRLGTTYTLRGDVAAEPIPEAGARLLIVAVSQVSVDHGATWRPADGRIEVKVTGPDDWFTPGYGDTLQLSGRLATAGTAAPAGVLAWVTNARTQIVARGGGNPLLAWLFALRVRLAEGIQRALPEPEAALLIGILLGLKTPVLRARLALFTATGTIHLVVPAGLKVSLLAAFARRGLAPLGRWPSAVGALAAVGAYAALGGGGAAALRAAIMGALLALAPALGRRYDLYSALAVAALLMTAVEPLLIADAGFQLTMLATLGIPLLTPTIQRWLLLPIARAPRLAGPLTPVAELLAVTLAAQFATLPVLAITFGQVSLVAPLANLLAVPLLAPLLVLGCVLAAAALAAPPLALVAAFVAWPLLWVVDQAIAWCAGIPAAALPVANVPAWAAGLYYALLAAVVIGVWRLRQLRAARLASATAAGAPPPVAHTTHSNHARPALALRGGLIALACLVLLGTCGAAAPALADSGARIDILDLGPGGSATLIRLAGGATALVDGGPSGPALDEALGARLPFWQRSLDLALLTDPRAGAITGLQDATTHFTIARAADGGMLHPTTAYLAWLDALSGSGTPRTRVRQDDTIHLDAATTLRVLSPPQALFPPSQGSTTASDNLILRLDTPGLRVLFLGDADPYALDALAFSGEPLAADVVVVGLAPTQGIDLDQPIGEVLRAAHPRLVVVTPAPQPPRTRPFDTLWPPDGPTAQTLGATILRTSDAGTVTLAQRGDGGWDLEGA